LFAFWHTLFSLILAVGLLHILHVNPSFLFLGVVVLAGVLPDVDHLLCWDDIFWERILPFKWWENLGVSWMPRAPVVLRIPLHMWLWPLILAFALEVVVKFYPSHTLLTEVLFAATVGWALHLLLDGILL